MQELLTQYPFIMLVMLMLSASEWIWVRYIRRGCYDLKASMASIGIAIGQVIIRPLAGGVIVVAYTIIYNHALWHFRLDDWHVWVAGFFAVEFAYYWFHRWSHTINWLWATHAVHHSPNELTLPAAIRLGWTGVISGGWLVFTPLVWLGFPPAMIGLLLGLNLLYQFGLHTEVVRKLGVLEYLFNTPSHHRAHHASDEKWLDCNFGGVLIIFDRWFGTFVAEPDEGGLRYGLTEPVTSYNPIIITFWQWAIMLRALYHAENWHTRMTVLFGRPSQLSTLASGASSKKCEPVLQQKA